MMYNAQPPGNYGQTPGYGSGNYSYAQSMQPNPAQGVQTMPAGLASMATALINGYNQQSPQPMQLQGAVQQPNFLQALFSGMAGAPGQNPVAAPSAGGPG